MSVESRFNSHAVRCDWRPNKNSDYSGAGFCTEIFRSNSVRSALVRQLEVAGWSISDRNRHHLCPIHKDKTPYETYKSGRNSNGEV